jgi:hypothetical protein
MGVVILDITYYLLHLGFHQVAAVGRLVKYKNRRNNAHNSTKTVQKHRIHRTENKNTKQKKA